jgi:signal transduction histidine kinase
MTEEDDAMTMTAVATKPRGEDGPIEADAHLTVPAEALARLDRYATASLLAAGLAHELANPLSCLMAGLDALAGRLGQARAQGGVGADDLDGLASDLELASVSAGEMFSLVRDFQLFLRPSAVATAPAIDLKPQIARALRMARARLGGTTPITVELAAAPPVRMPAAWATQIVLNLLLNAADALAGRPWSANLVEVRLETLDHWAVIEVKDNGPGLEADVRARLFEPGASSKDGPASLGLGLAICRALARAAGGDVTVSSPAPAGTLFRVVLPPAASPSPSAA